MAGMRSVYKILFEQSEGIRPLGELRRRCEDNIKVNLNEVECEDVDWFHATQNGVLWRALCQQLMNP
jgi:hypothetical protein